MRKREALRVAPCAVGPGAQYVNDMYLGWNLGNTMDASGGETGWGNPVTTQAMVDAVHKMGFKFLRLPVTWKGHFGSNAPYTDGNAPYTIDPTWLARVVTIANYAPERQHVCDDQYAPRRDNGRLV
jgi:endoglucanase